MKRKVWLVLAVVPVLLAAYAVRRSSIPAPVSGGEAPVGRRTQPEDAPQSGRALGAGMASASLPQEAIGAGIAPGDLNPFALLDKQYEAQRTAETARFDEEEARIKARIQPALDTSVAKHRDETENLERMNLTADQKMQWNKQLNIQYEKARQGIKRAIQPQLDELDVKRREALEKLASDRAQKRTRLQELQALAEKGRLDPVAAKRAQFELLGVSLPPSAFPAPPEPQAPTGARTAPPQDRPPAVQALVATGDRRFCALIEDALVSEGDTVQGYRVRKIRENSVEFEKNGQTWVQRPN